MPSVTDSPKSTSNTTEEESNLNEEKPVEDKVELENGTSSINEGSQGTPKKKTIKIEDDDPPRLTDDDGWLDILGSGELKKKVFKAGKGDYSRPPRGSWVTLILEGKLEDGTIVEPKETHKVVLGDCELVQGMDVAVALMEQGEAAQIKVPARLAYGRLGRLPLIPPDSNIIYDAELVTVEETEEEKDLPIPERLRIGDYKRERGNFWYSRGDYSNAIHCYRRSLDFLDDYDQNLEGAPSELQKLLDMRLKVFNNLAASQLKIEAFDAALKSVECVLMIQPDNVKALFRKGKILGSKNQTNEAIEALRRAVKLEPETKIIHQELAKAVGKQRSYELEEKAMYRKMFPPTVTDNSKHKTHGSSKLQRFGLLLGSVLIVVLGVAVYKHIHSSH